MILRPQNETDSDAVAALLARAFGPGHPARAVWNLRLTHPVEGLALVCELADRLVGSLRFWQISLAGQPQLLLGPLAVEPDLQGAGIGQSLVKQGLGIASQSGYQAVLVSGEAHYYGHFDFVPAPANLRWPGPIEAGRLQIKELKPGYLASLPKGPLAILPDPEPAPKLEVGFLTSAQSARS